MKSLLIFTTTLGLFISILSSKAAPELTNSLQKISYALGMDIATKLKMDEVDIDMKALKAGMADMQAGTPALSPEQQKATMQAMQTDIQARAESKKQVASAKNLKAGQEFLAANAKKEGVKVITGTAADGTKGEVQYLVLKSGTGPLPAKGDTLKLHYEGRLLDGTIFDSSVQRGTPFIGRANDFIAGWTEPLQLMKVGDKWRLFIPPSLGYGAFEPYNIGPQSTLIYDIELLGVEKPAAK